MPRIIPPRPGPDEQFFWDGVAEGRLLVRVCADCGRRQHPPSPMCPACGAVEWTVDELAGVGTVVSWVVSRHPSRPDEDPRVVALVELDEGVRLVSNLADVPADQLVRAIDDGPDHGFGGRRVEVRFEQVAEDVTLPQFHLLPEGTG